MIARADALMWTVPVDVITQLESHFRAQMRRISDLTPDAEDAPGK